MRIGKGMNVKELEVKYGLPSEVKFCKICNIINQRPNSVNEYEHNPKSQKKTIGFDEDGICSACRNKETQHENIDWKQREKELMDICDRYRKTDGSYDCIAPGSGGKDSIFAAHLLKYKYGMHPLTVTWSPHLYTDIGWKNFQNWLHIGGFDNFLFTPNGRVHRLLTRLSVINLLHPFQPFIMGQKTFVAKMCAKFDIPLAFYGEMPGEYGTTEASDGGSEKKFSDKPGSGFSKDVANGKDVRDLYLGGVQSGEIIEKYDVDMNDLLAYFPLDYSVYEEKEIDVYYLGYFIKWDPQECYYYSVENAGFEANPVRTEGTYSKYNSLDDKIDGFNYYTGFIKFGMGRAMQDAAQEIRNKKITTEEGKALIKKFDGEFPKRYYKEFLSYIDMEDEEFRQLCDKFRSEHLWAKVNGEWKRRHTVNGDGVDD
ncbi:MAG: N-acetyl sugar amidotransferase [Candidatus Omnitrophica bacterium]|nr:N-acetyl sugar amidotransferase [Candidatus Omnitrophota bacterium]